MNVPLGGDEMVFYGLNAFLFFFTNEIETIRLA